MSKSIIKIQSLNQFSVNISRKKSRLTTLVFNLKHVSRLIDRHNDIMQDREPRLKATQYVRHFVRLLSALFETLAHHTDSLILLVDLEIIELSLSIGIIIHHSLVVFDLELMAAADYDVTAVQMAI